MKLKVFLSIIILSVVMSFSVAYGKELKTEPEVVELEGRFVQPEYLEKDSGKNGRFYAIELEYPVDVAGDEFAGPKKKVKLIQLMLMEDPAAIKTLVKKIDGKKITVTGTLFHAMTVHHYTRVLVTVQSIMEVPSRARNSEAADAREKSL